MAGKSRRGDGVTVSFGAKFAQSDQFRTVFREGMALVEVAATYLDGDGRKEARKLQPPLFARLCHRKHAAHHAAHAARVLAPDPAGGERRRVDARAGARRAAQDQASSQGKRSAEPGFQCAAAPAERADRAEHQIAGAHRAARSDARPRASARDRGGRSIP